MNKLLFLLLLLLLLLLLFNKCTEAISCPQDWINFQRHCYSLKKFARNWYDAEVACQAFGENGHLASIHDEDDMKALSQHLSQNLKTEQHIWIGLYDPNTGSEHVSLARWGGKEKKSFSPFFFFCKWHSHFLNICKFLQCMLAQRQVPLALCLCCLIPVLFFLGVHRGTHTSFGLIEGQYLI
uniref:C-type lectin domain-containing protein n=1 Tax=Podarcis muralis TaxID=64176 RepID=A0A670JEX7_PODMU